MDLLRSVIESFYYSFPLSTVSSCVAAGSDGNTLLKLLLEVVKWQNRSFTKSEIGLLSNILENDWMCLKGLAGEDDIINKDNASFWDRILLLPEKFSQKVLHYDSQKYPIVSFDNLLRWRNLSLLVGEDLLVLPFIARHDAMRDISNRRDFCWPNILDHDNFRINDILERELSDTHSHVNAAQDVFEFNWITIMNNTEALNSKTLAQKRCFLNDGPLMQYDIIHRNNIDVERNLQQWIKTASVLRAYLFSVILRDDYTVNQDEIRQSLYDLTLLDNLLKKTNTKIGVWKEVAFKLRESQFAFDYTILNDESIDCSVLMSPYMIHYGERKLIYEWYRLFYLRSKQVKASHDLMVLYLLIKGKIRREFIQTNDLSGFENFQEYQDSKSLFITVAENRSKWMSVQQCAMAKYAIQSSIGDKKKHYLEARLTPQSLAHWRRFDFTKSIFEARGLDDDCAERSQVGLVAHFIKSKDKKTDTSFRHADFRKKMWNDAEIVVKEYKTNHNENLIPIIGIDAASSELECRPEVIAPIFRYCRFFGIRNFTYHAGEDFYDIIDGLRTINEIINFAGFSYGNRIGHGLALGEDSNRYYASRHNTLIVPRQILLDNVVWMKYRSESNNIELSPQTKFFIDKTFSELVVELGYSVISKSTYDYFLSMNMRGNAIYPKEKIENLSLDVKYSPISPSSPGKIIEQLWMRYESDEDCRKKGLVAKMITIPSSYGDDVRKLQENLLSEIENRGIVIETNPSSNLKIGRFDRYDQHPITRFHNVIDRECGHNIVVSINTDDKGVFATSLKNEYSLIAIALKKKKDLCGNPIYNENQIENYLRTIARFGNITRFKP